MKNFIKTILLMVGAIILSSCANVGVEGRFIADGLPEDAKIYKAIRVKGKVMQGINTTGVPGNDNEIHIDYENAYELPIPCYIIKGAHYDKIESMGLLLAKHQYGGRYFPTPINNNRWLRPSLVVKPINYYDTERLAKYCDVKFIKDLR